MIVELIMSVWSLKWNYFRTVANIIKMAKSMDPRKYKFVPLSIKGSSRDGVH